MLLRKSSSPILKSWLPSNHYTNNPNSSPNNINERTLSLPRTNSFSAFTASSSSPSSPSKPYHDRDHFKPATCTLFETDVRDPHVPQTKTTSLQRMFSSSGLDMEVSLSEDGGGGDGGGGVGHRGCGGGFGFNNDYSSNDDNNMEAYYERMIKANPVDPLLFGNYARFLKEVRRNLGKAEEYCERAIILGSPSDGNTLSLYADIIWQHRGDAQRAETYFDRAIQAAPNDCYVHASYAKFLWDSEDDDDEAGEEECRDKVCNDPTPSSSPHYLEETPRRLPLITN